MTEYTLGLVFTHTFRELLLITRGEHAFHTNKSNGLGGKIIIGESPVECIVREVKEESGIETKESQWKFMGVINGITWKVWVFSTSVEKKVDFPTISEGTLRWHPSDALPENRVTNLTWIIPFVLEKWKDPTLQSFVVWYAGPAQHTTD